MIRFLTPLVLVACLAGCLSPGEVVETLRYPVEPAPSVDTFPATDRTLGIRPLGVARPYDLRMVVFRGDAEPLEFKRHAEWAERPEAVVSRAVSDALTRTGRFADVGDAASMRPPDYILTGEVRRYRENRSGAGPVAEVEVRLELRRAQGRGAPWAQTLRGEVALDVDTPNGLATAMAAAVAKLAEEAASEIAGLD